MEIVHKKESVSLTKDEEARLIRIIDMFSEIYNNSHDTGLKSTCEKCHQALSDFITMYVEQ